MCCNISTHFCMYQVCALHTRFEASRSTFPVQSNDLLLPFVHVIQKLVLDRLYSYKRFRSSAPALDNVEKNNINIL